MLVRLRHYLRPNADKPAGRSASIVMARDYDAGSKGSIGWIGFCCNLQEHHNQLVLKQCDGRRRVKMPKLGAPIAAILSGVAFIAAPVASQEINPVVRERMVVAQTTPERRMEQVRVQVVINFFVPGPTNDSDEASRARERARRVVYEIAGRECTLLEDSLAIECRLESVTVNLNRQSGHQQQEGFTATGTLGFRIMLK
jgi:hypothetical protein